ncbi:MAG TPA: glycosyltransferase family 39 protein [Candidatus Nanoarchaeia archaeon]|nr:glycosyltransferase family 39 protein [Candidatus Nanoarchaeia archaeon]
MNKKTFFWLGLILLFSVILRIVFFNGVGASDDVQYSFYANEMSTGHYNLPSDHHGTRLAFVYAISRLYLLFGVNDFSSVILQFLLSIGNILLIFSLGKLLFNEKTGLLGAFLMSFFPIEVIFSTKLMPEIPSVFLLGLCVFLFFKGEKSKIKKSARLLYISSGLSLGLAYLMRENSVLILIFFAIYALINKKIKSEYFLMAAGFIFWVLVDMYSFYIFTGNYFFRISNLNGHLADIYSVENYYGRGSITGFLFSFPFIIFRDLQLGLFYPFIFIAILYFIFSREKPAYNMIFWFVPILLYLIFGTISLSKYLPLPAIPRYLMIIDFPAILILAYFLNIRNQFMKIISPCIVIILLFTSIGYLYLERQNNASNLDNIYLNVKNLNGRIYTDYRTKLVMEYKSGYEQKNILEFNRCANIYVGCKDNTSFVLTRQDVKNSYVLVNNKMINSLSSIHAVTNFPVWLNNVPTEWEVIKTGDGWTLYYTK